MSCQVENRHLHFYPGCNLYEWTVPAHIYPAKCTRDEFVLPVSYMFFLDIRLILPLAPPSRHLHIVIERSEKIQKRRKSFG